MHEVLPAREVPLGGPRALLVRRTLPGRTIRTIGPWCFVDHYGPADATGAGAMDVPPHPHTGLQTVSWLLEGEVLHHDSLGSSAVIRPGELNLMTSGHGIAHSEQSTGPSRRLHGVQLWVALPDADRHQPPHFEHHATLPSWSDRKATATVVMGSLGGVSSPARAYSPIIGAHLRLAAGATETLPLDRSFEHAVLLLDGSASVDGVPLEIGSLLYLGGSRRELAVAAERPAQVLLIGGAPFEEDLLMWWNFVGRTHDEILEARTVWEAGPSARFDRVAGYQGDRLAAPALPTTVLRARPARRRTAR